MKIGNLEIGTHEPPAFIAELSGNHNGSLQRALELVDLMAEAGAHAIKLQTYTADTMTIDCDRPDFVVSDPASLWSGKSLYELYEIAHTPWEWHEQLFARAAEHGIPMLSTPFEPTAVEFLESLDAPAYKIASFESNDPALLEAVAATGKPVIMSTGLSDLSDIASSVRVLRNAGADDIVLLKCTSAYPSDAADANLLTIPNLRNALGVHVGLSDHTLGLAVPLAAVALGAVVIEKHVTRSRSEGGVDSAFSLEPPEVADLVRESRRAWDALGSVNYELRAAEEQSLKFRRSVYVVADVAAGERLTERNTRVIRPGYGLAPAELPRVLGRRARVDIARGTSLSYELLD